MYKCTDGTMNASDFSFKGCFSFGDGSDDKPQEDKSATEEVTASPLLSDSSSMGNLIGSGSIDNEDDEGEDEEEGRRQASDPSMTSKKYEVRSNK